MEDGGKKPCCFVRCVLKGKTGKTLVLPKFRGCIRRNPLLKTAFYYPWSCLTKINDGAPAPGKVSIWGLNHSLHHTLKKKNKRSPELKLASALLLPSTATDPLWPELSNVVQKLWGLLSSLKISEIQSFSCPPENFCQSTLLRNHHIFGRFKFMIIGL